MGILPPPPPPPPEGIAFKVERNLPGQENLQTPALLARGFFNQPN
jgi:hypothetical protein